MSAQKIEKEIKIINTMIDIYKKGHPNEDVETLREYAVKRIEKCPRMETKTFCSRCDIHCYQKVMRDQIKQVMRYSGPRLIWHHPIQLIKHILGG